MQQQKKIKEETQLLRQLLRQLLSQLLLHLDPEGDVLIFFAGTFLSLPLAHVHFDQNPAYYPYPIVQPPPTTVHRPPSTPWASWPPRIFFAFSPHFPRSFVCLNASLRRPAFLFAFHLLPTGHLLRPGPGPGPALWPSLSLAVSSKSQRRIGFECKCPDDDGDGGGGGGGGERQDEKQFAWLPLFFSHIH